MLSTESENSLYAVEPFSDLTVVIRSVGERTEAACRALAVKQVSAENVVVICERPFGEAVRKTFRIGMERGRRWTLALDADVLLRADALRDMINCVEDQPHKIFFANFFVADKLLGQVRDAGVHMYQTKLLGKGLSSAGPDIDNYERPESLVRARMAVKGYMACEFRGLIVGLHDFEQSYRDIYRKTYTHVLKHPSKRIEPSIAAWKRLAETDQDFRVALAGAEDSRRTGGKALIDDNLFPSSVQEIVAIKGIEEKCALAEKEKTGEEICQLLNCFSPFPENIRVKGLFKSCRGIRETKDGFVKKVWKGVRDVGIIRFPFLCIGVLLQTIGSNLVRFAQKK